MFVKPVRRVDGAGFFWYDWLGMASAGKSGIGKIAAYFLAAFGLAILFPVFVELAFANAWWGEGARDLDWVLKHGGTVIRCEINDISGDSSEYKAVMYKKGRYAEKEFGTKMTFDDAKGGKYKISAYRGGTLDRTTYKGGKKFASIEFTAHPGETIRIKFNYKKKSAKMTTDYDESKEEAEEKPKPVSLPAPKPESEPADELQSEPEPEPQENPDVSEGQAFQPENAPTNEAESIAESVEEIVHPDAMAAEFKKLRNLPDPNEKIAGFFGKAWDSVVVFFRFDWMHP